MGAISARSAHQAIGRASFNKLYRMFSRSKLPKDLRLRFFESFIASTMHGSSSAPLYDDQSTAGQQGCSLR